MARIFISYRRTDSRLVTNRIYDRLADAFGKANVFKDVDNIPAGHDFRYALREATLECRVMLVVIGPAWVTDRLDNPNDFVRLEVETGLQREGLMVIPLLVEGATMPDTSQLPESIHELVFKNAFVIHDDPLFHRDMDRLIPYLRRLLRSKRRTLPAVAALAAVLAIVGAFVIVGLPILNNASSPPNTPTHTSQGIAQASTNSPTGMATVEMTSTRAEAVIPSAATATSAAQMSSEATLDSLRTLASGGDLSQEQMLTYQDLMQRMDEITDGGSGFSNPFSGKTSTFTPTPTITPTWTPRTESMNGIDMVQVPSGCFIMGSSELSDARVHSQCIDDSFMISVTEVTNAQYARCVNEGGCTPPHNQTYFADNRYTNYPVIYVDWYQAQAFADWWGGSLPSERQWEYAARGSNSRQYPWGNAWLGANANTVGVDDGFDWLAPVRQFNVGGSWVGALDMAGNVWEWTRSEYRDYPYVADDGREVPPQQPDDIRVVRGGSWSFDALAARSAYRHLFAANYSDDNIGFRVVGVSWAQGLGRI